MSYRLSGHLATLVTICALFFGALWFSETFLQDRNLHWSVYIFTLLVWVGKYVDPTTIIPVTIFWLIGSVVIGLIYSLVVFVGLIGQETSFLYGVSSRFIEGSFMISGLSVGWFVLEYLGTVLEKRLFHPSILNSNP